VELDLAGAVDEVEKRHLAGLAAGGDAPGDAVGVLGLLAGGEVRVGDEDAVDRCLEIPRLLIVGVSR